MIHCVMALACAVDPSELSEPVAHFTAGADELVLATGLLLAPAEVEELDLLELLHAVNATAIRPAVRPAKTPVRVSFTEVPLRISRFTKGTLRASGGLMGWLG